MLKRHLDSKRRQEVLERLFWYQPAEEFVKTKAEPISAKQELFFTAIDHQDVSFILKKIFKQVGTDLNPRREVLLRNAISHYLFIFEQQTGISFNISEDIQLEMLDQVVVLLLQDIIKAVLSIEDKSLLQLISGLISTIICSDQSFQAFSKKSKSKKEKRASGIEKFFKTMKIQLKGKFNQHQVKNLIESVVFGMFEKFAAFQKRSKLPSSNLEIASVKLFNLISDFVIVLGQPHILLQLAETSSKSRLFNYLSSPEAVDLIHISAETWLSEVKPKHRYKVASFFFHLHYSSIKPSTIASLIRQSLTEWDSVDAPSEDKQYISGKKEFYRTLVSIHSKVKRVHSFLQLFFVALKDHLSRKPVSVNKIPHYLDFAYFILSIIEDKYFLFLLKLLYQDTK